jgi:hypothetical protein
MKKLEGGFFEKNEMSKQSASTNASENTTGKSASNTSDLKFKLKKGRRNSHRSNATYRIDVLTLDRIEELSRLAHKSINDTVQELLDFALDNVDIE